MSVKILAETLLMSDPETGPFYRTNFELTVPVNGFQDGAIITPITDGVTESVYNATFAQAVADNANQQAATTQFTAADVIGGRI